MALYSPSGPRSSQRRPRGPQPLGPSLKSFAIGWAGLCALGLLLVVLDGDMLDGPACGRLALASLGCCLLGAICLRFRPDGRALRALGAAAVGFPFGVVALGVVTPLEPWPPSAPMWWIFGALFAGAFFWAVVKPE